MSGRCIWFFVCVNICSMVCVRVFVLVLGCRKCVYCLCGRLKKVLKKCGSLVCFSFSSVFMLSRCILWVVCCFGDYRVV